MTLSPSEITYIVAAACGILALSAYVGWILVPAWKSYSRAWERVAATFLTLYVAVAFVGVGILCGALVAYFWDELHF